jgi:hypothetical protein
MWSILDIYVPRDFPWYKERHKSWNFDPWNRSLKFQESTGTPSPKVGVALGVWGFTPSQFPTFFGVCNVTLGLSLDPHPCNPFALVANPKLGLRQKLKKCIKCFTLDMRVYVGMQWSIGIIVVRGHELDTWHVSKNVNKKWDDTTLGPKGNEIITITCYTYHACHE